MTQTEASQGKIRLLAADMWSIFNFGEPNERYQKFIKRGRPAFKQLIENILMYREVVIPTQDFLNLALLVGVLGEHSVIDLLETRSMRFLRLKGSIGYVGNGHGIQAYEINHPGEVGEPLAFCGPVDCAVAWALGGLKDKPRDPILPRLVIDSTEEVEVKSLLDKVRHESYMDILNSPYLRALYSLRNTDMNRLVGINPNQVRVYGGPDGQWTGDEIDIVMLLAGVNLELFLAETAHCMDMSTGSPIGHLMKAKAERCFSGTEAVNSFAVLREIAGIPDIGEEVLKGQISIEELLKLSHSSDGGQFRQWFHKNCREDPVTTAREYALLLKAVPKIQSIPLKVLRFIFTTVIGMIPGVGQVVGPPVSVIDSFFIDRWLKGDSPKFFIENLSQLQRGAFYGYPVEDEKQ